MLNQNLSQQNEKIDQEQALVYTDYPTIREKIAASFDQKKVVVVFTDIDATFVLGSGHHDHEISTGQLIMKELVSNLNKESAIIIPITGSHFDSGTKTTNSILNRIEAGVLPQVGTTASNTLFAVDAYISDGGAKAVHALNERNISYDSHYMSSVQPSSLNYDQLLAHTKKLTTAINQRELSTSERELIYTYDSHAESNRIHAQPGTENGSHRASNKIAFYFYANTLQERDQIELQFITHVKDFGMNVVCCEEKDANTAARRHPTLAAQADTEGFPLKYCLDIVPFDKGSAVKHFSNYISHIISEHALSTGKERPLMEVWACGDSGNDYPLMSSAVVTHAVIVGGASKELIRLGERLQEFGKTVYIESDPNRLGPASIAQAIFGDPHTV